MMDMVVVLAVVRMMIGLIINLFLIFSLGRVGYEKRDDCDGAMIMSWATVHVAIELNLE